MEMRLPPAFRISSARGRRLLIAAAALALVLVPAAPASAHAHRRSRLLVRRYISAAAGGYVRARDGAAIFVPPRVMRRSGWVTIRRRRDGIFDPEIHARWKGRVWVTLPEGRRRRRLRALLHYRHRRWNIEATGTTDAWLTHLSPLTTLNHFIGLTECTLDVGKAALRAAAWGTLAAAAAYASPEDLGASLVISDVALEKAAEAAGDVTFVAWAKCLTKHGLHSITKSLFNDLNKLTHTAIDAACSNLNLDWLSSGLNPCTGAEPLYSLQGSSGSPGQGLQISTSSGPSLQGGNVQGTSLQGGSAAGLQGEEPPPATSPSTTGSTSTPPPPEEPSPKEEQKPSPSPKGFVIEDDIYGGTWARTDPYNGTWYPRSTPPPNGAYWYPNGLGVAVSCAESAAAYPVIINGAHETWSWWAHVTDGKWVPTVVFSTVWADGLPSGLSQC